MYIARTRGRGPHRGKDQERKKDEQEKDLRNPAQQRQSGLSHEFFLWAGRAPRWLGGRAECAKDYTRMIRVRGFVRQ